MRRGQLRLTEHFSMLKGEEQRKCVWEKAGKVMISETKVYMDS